MKTRGGEANLPLLSFCFFFSFFFFVVLSFRNRKKKGLVSKKAEARGRERRRMACRKEGSSTEIRIFCKYGTLLDRSPSELSPDLTIEEPEVLYSASR